MHGVMPRRWLTTPRSMSVSMIQMPAVSPMRVNKLTSNMMHGFATPGGQGDHHV